MNPFRDTQCDGKARYTHKHAKRAARGVSEHGDPARAYACRHCGHWHVGGYSRTTGRSTRMAPAEKKHKILRQGQ